MKINYIKIKILNLKLEEVTLKLPMKNSNLQKILIKKEITDVEHSSIRFFNNPLKSVKDIEIDNFKLVDSTNIYYLNCYFDIIKIFNLDLPETNVFISTNHLQQMISEILKIKDRNLDLIQIYDVINNLNHRTTINKIQKPKFSIYKLLLKRKEGS